SRRRLSLWPAHQTERHRRSTEPPLWRWRPWRNGRWRPRTWAVLMDPVRPELLPDPSSSREEMESLQREVAADAHFVDEFSFDPATVSASPTLSTTATRSPVVVGIDQAFLDDRAVGAVVALRGGEVIERASAVVDLEFPYIPGLLSFREAGAIVAAFGNLDVDPDLAVFDGSGRIHYREAGLATHLGYVFDLPSIGVAK